MTTNVTTGESISLFEQFFVNPIIQRTGYNVVNTIAYGCLMVIIAYLLFRLLKKFGYKMNLDFLKATAPFIVLVIVWRVLTDSGVYAYNYLTTTPGLYIPVLSIYFPIMMLAKYLERVKGWKYQWIYTGVPVILLITQTIILLTLFPGNFNVEAFWKVIYFFLIASAPFILLASLKDNKNKFIKVMSNPFNALMFIGHMFDASATHVSIEYFNYFEQHVIPRTIFNLTGSSLSFFIWKIIVLGVVIYLLDKDNNNKELARFIKMIFIIYGFGIGLRNSLRLFIGV